jgi:hypothetical protein
MTKDEIEQALALIALSPVAGHRYEQLHSCSATRWQITIRRDTTGDLNYDCVCYDIDAFRYCLAAAISMIQRT